MEVIPYTICVLGAIAATCISSSWLYRKGHEKIRAKMKEGIDAAGSKHRNSFIVQGIEGRILTYACTLDQKLSFGSATPLVPRSLAHSARAEAFLEKHRRRAGLPQHFSVESYQETRFRLGAYCLLLFTLFGSFASAELAALGIVAGVFVGAKALPVAIAAEEKVRTEKVEEELPQMLEVIALGLRSGLTFDRSLRLYWTHFDTLLASECASAQHRWDFGLQTREQSLRELAASYGSSAFERVVENIVRALRHGTSLEENLETSAQETRLQQKAIREEKIAKAPVKMMLPIGGLILPALLLFILGPVILQLVESL